MTAPVQEATRDAYAQAPGILVSLTLDGTVAAASGAGWAWLDLRPENVVGRSYADVPALAALAGRALAGESFTASVQLADRRLAWHWTHGPTGATGLAVEATAHPHAATITAIVEQSPDAIFIKDLAGRYLLVNSAAAAMIGLPVAAVVGRDDLAILPPEVAARVQAEDRIVMASGDVRTYEYEVTNLDGRTIALHGSKAPFRSVEGELLGVIGTSHDITDRKAMERALRESEQRLAEAQRLAGLGCWEVEPATGRVAWTDELFRLYGLDMDAVKPSLDMMLAMTHPDDRQALSEVLDSGGEPWLERVVEQRIVRSDGRLRSVYSHIRCERDADGRTTRMLGTTQDVTERRHAERELQAAVRELARLSRLKDEFVSTVSHEFRTPLSVIKNGALILHRKKAGPTTPEQDRFLAMMLDYIGRLTRLTDDMLDLQRFQLDIRETARPEADVAAIAREAASDVRHMFEAQHIALIVAVEGPLSAPVDRDMLARVIHNLLANALKFTPPGGRVTLTGGPEGDDVRLAVSDTGIGIAPEHLAQVFMPFVQLSGEQPHATRGSGLGLAICRVLVEKVHQGRLEIESEKGVGSTFSVCLPGSRAAGL